MYKMAETIYKMAETIYKMAETIYKMAETIHRTIIEAFYTTTPSPIIFLATARIRFPRRQFGKNCQTWELFRTAAGQVFSGTLPPEPYECSGLDTHAICCPCGPLVDVGGLVSSYTPFGSNLLLPITNCDRATE